MAGLYVIAARAGVYKPARSREEPSREIRTCPLYLPDSCSRGLSPANAVTALHR